MKIKKDGQLSANCIETKENGYNTLISDSKLTIRALHINKEHTTETFIEISFFPGYNPQRNTNAKFGFQLSTHNQQEETDGSNN